MSERTPVHPNKHTGRLRFTVEVPAHGEPVIWLGRNLKRPREHVPMPKPLVDALKAYALEVVGRD